MLFALMRGQMALALVVVAGLTAAAAPAAGTSVPTKLLGKYHRTLSAQQLARTAFPQAVGRWSLTFSKDGTVFAQGQAAFSAYLHASAAGPGRLKVSTDICGPRTATYRWTMSGKSLKLTKVDDRCGDRAVILTGVWKRS